jgi:RHS repeat-associated protein
LVNRALWKQPDSSNATTRTYFFYDGDTPVLELDSTGQVSAINTFGANGLVSRRTNNATVFYAFDERGNVAQRLDASGTVLSSHVTDAFGVTVNEPANASPSPFGFGGQFGYYTDEETGLVLCTHRYYSTKLGRWMTRDPIGYAGGINLYGFVNNNPIIFADPEGHVLNFVIGAASSVATGLVIAGVEAAVTGRWTYGWNDAARDAALGAVGVGIAIKAQKLLKISAVGKRLFWFGKAEHIAAKEVGGVFVGGAGAMGVHWGTIHSTITKLTSASIGGSTRVTGRATGACKDFAKKPYEFAEHEAEKFFLAVGTDFHLNPLAWYKGALKQYWSREGKKTAARYTIESSSLGGTLGVPSGAYGVYKRNQ